MERYALYFAPAPDSALATFGQRWLSPKNALTSAPARYGLHATLKAPFRLAAGTDFPALQAEVECFTAARPPVSTGPLGLSTEHGFAALRVTAGADALRQRAGEIVRGFEPFRAPLTDAELAKRRRAALTPRQDAQLIAFGYPYIFDDFDLHITLTGRIPAGQDAHALLLPQVAEFCDDPFILDAITIFGDPGGDAPFEQLSRHPFRGAEAT